MGNKRTINIFISYAQQGPPYAMPTLEKYLSNYIRHTNRNRFKLNIWYDRSILLGGQGFNKKIEDHILAADLVLLLVTTEFIESTYILSKERPLIVKCHEEHENVVPILIGHMHFEGTWVYKLEVATLPDRYDKIITNSRHKYWKEVRKGLEAIIEDKYREKYPKAAKQEQSEPNDGCFQKMLLGLVIAILLVMVYPNIQKWMKDHTKQTTEVVTPTPPTPKPKPIPPKPSPVHPVVDDPIVDEYDDKSDTRNRKKENISPNPDRKKRPTFEPELEKLVKYYEINDVQKVPRPLGGKAYYGAESYGHYESCQAVNRNGYKPCKKDRRWFLVNEVKDIHHKISFPDIMHKQIYAIRPYYEDFAEVYFYNGTEMYLAFCLDLEDQPEYCMTKFAD